MESTPAILLKKIRLTESSLIATWMGESTGKIKTVIRSALKSNSKFAGRVDLFYEADIFFALPKKGDLHPLQDIAVRRRHLSEGAEYTAIVMGSYFVGLTDLLMEPSHPMPTIYDLLRRALGHLDTRKPSLKALHHFETEMCRLLGFHNPGTRNGAHHFLLFDYAGRSLSLRSTLVGLLKKES